MFDIDFDRHRNASPTPLFKIGSIAFHCAGPTGGMTIAARPGGAHALVAAPVTIVDVTPAANEFEFEGDARGPVTAFEFLNSTGTVSRREVVSGTGAFHRGWSATGTEFVRITGSELVLFRIKGT